MSPHARRQKQSTNNMQEMMNPVSPFPRCAACGDRIGVYEPIWLQKPDGSVVGSALLELESPARDLRLFHSGCLAAAGGGH